MNPGPAAAVRMTAITKRYPRVFANRGANLEVAAGEVHAIVGENGAGKSTLMKVLYGLVAPDEGEIEVHGRPLRRHSPAQAIAAGLGMVFQHFMLVGPLTVAENVFLGMEPRRGPFLDRARAVSEVRALGERFGLPIDPSMRVEDCSVGLQQRVEILKVLLRQAKVIVLDEPTAVLTPQEVDELLATLRRLAAEGKTILLITHKLREVMAASDRVTVMRAGQTVATLPTRSTTAEEIAHLMIGRGLDRPARPPRRPPGEVVLEAKGLCARSGHGTDAIRGVDLTVHAGEIVGVAGIEGNGQTELVEVVAGLRPASAGSVRLAGRELAGLSPRRRYEAGLAHVPADRHRRAIVLEFTVEENSILGMQRTFVGRLGLRFREMARHVRRIVESCDVRPTDPGIRTLLLSGGNQQKVVIGRELSRRPKLLLAAHPTRGLDVGASEFVMRSLLAERERGAGVLFVSAELPELLAVADRIVVFYGGRIVGEVDPEAVDERRLGLLMTGHS